jgi:hypothetical protein
MRRRLSSIVILLFLAFSGYLLEFSVKERIKAKALKYKLEQTLGEKQKQILRLNDEVVSSKKTIENLEEEIKEYKTTLSSRVYYESLIVKKAKIRSKKSLYELDDDVFFTMVGQCEKYKIPYEIYFRLIDMESGFKFVENKSSGAYGYMQVMPKTFTYLSKKIGVKGKHDETNNIIVGSYLLNHNYNSWKRRGFSENKSWRLALAAYNAGEGKLQIKRDGKVVGWREPSYTSGYVNYIMKYYS